MVINTKYNYGDMLCFATATKVIGEVKIVRVKVERINIQVTQDGATIIYSVKGNGCKHDIQECFLFKNERDLMGSFSENIRTTISGKVISKKDKVKTSEINNIQDFLRRINGESHIYDAEIDGLFRDEECDDLECPFEDNDPDKDIVKWSDR